MIHQLQVTYLTEHDRILVRMNTRAGEEIRLWLTRALLRNLHPHLAMVTNEIAALAPAQAQGPAQNAAEEPTGSVAHDGADSRALIEFKKQESLQKTDFSTPFAAQAQTLPLGGEPLLATTAQLTVLESGQLRLGFEEKLAVTDKNRQVEITLGADLLNGLMHLLDLALSNANWGLGVAPATLFKKPVPPDAFATAMPPQYLN